VRERSGRNFQPEKLEGQQTERLKRHKAANTINTPTFQANTSVVDSIPSETIAGWFLISSHRPDAW
jgi:hypothetical protein